MLRSAKFPAKYLIRWFKNAQLLPVANSLPKTASIQSNRCRLRPATRGISCHSAIRPSRLHVTSIELLKFKTRRDVPVLWFASDWIIVRSLAPRPLRNAHRAIAGTETILRRYFFLLLTSFILVVINRILSCWTSPGQNLQLLYFTVHYLSDGSKPTLNSSVIFVYDLTIFNHLSFYFVTLYTRTEYFF